VTHQLWTLDPATYVPHPLHRAERLWPESNCYVDLWIEVLHNAGAEPLAAAPFVFGADLEGDQWTFFKFPLADLEALFGITVFELNIYRPLIAHLGEQLSLARTAIVEVDGFFLPDTAGTSYHAEHVKTSIAVQAIDPVRRRLGYFHNAGYYELTGDDFAGVFRLEGHLTDPEYLPPYVEVAKLVQGPAPSRDVLVKRSLSLLRAHLHRRPTTNPFRRYAARFSDDVTALTGRPLDCFHKYAFATLRQCGAAFELGGAYLRWLQEGSERGLESAIDACDRIANTSKVLQFKTARAVATKKPIAATEALGAMAAAWDETMATLMAHVA
jgi:hypothetical protein